MICNIDTSYFLNLIAAELYKRKRLNTVLGRPDGSFVSTGACNLEVPGSNPGPAGYFLLWLCIYSAQTVRIPGVQCCLWYWAL